MGALPEEFLFQWVWSGAYDFTFLMRSWDDAGLGTILYVARTQDNLGSLKVMYV